MKKCKRCDTYNVVLVADKDELSQYYPIAAQSDSDVLSRWVYAHPNIATDYCYYCTKVINGQITKHTDYGYGYEAKQTPRFEIGASA